MAGIKIPDLPSYGSIDTSKAKKDLLITTKNDGTYGTPSYPTNASKQLTVEDLATMLPLPLNGNAFRLYNLGQTELVANTYNIIGNPATAPTVTTFTLPTVLPNKMLVAGIGATVDPFIIEITGGYSGGSASNPITVQMTEVGDTVFFIGTDYGWQYVGSNKLTDLTGYATESYVDAKVEDTIVNGVTDKAPSQNAVYDAIAAIPTPTLATVTTAGATTTNDITVGSATVSNTTASTLPFIDSAKKLISATGSLLGTWFQTLATKSIPIDADTLLTGDSENGYETKITTYTQLWTNYIKGKADAVYNQIYTTTRYAKVDYVNGSDVTGLVQRQDKPFATLQACYNAVVSASASSSESWEIEVVGDKTFTSNALEITAQKNNVTIIFKGNITNSIPNSEAKGLICETGNYNSSNWNIIFYNYTQTTNNGTWTGSWASSTIEFKTATIKNGKNASKCYGLTQTGTNNKLNADNLTWDITNDTSFTAYQYLTSLGTNFKMEIDTLNVIGAVTGSSVYRNFYYGAGAYIKINKVNWNPTNYTNLAYFAMNDSGGSADYIEINFFDQALDTNVKNNFYIFYQGVSTRCLRIETGNFLGNYASVVFTNGSIESLIVQNIVSNGRFLYALKCNLQINGQIKQYTASTTLTSLIYVQGGSKISGGKIIGNLTGVDPNSQGTIFVSKNGSDGTLGITIANCDVYNVGVPATSTVAVPCILHSGGTVGAQLFLYLQNCKMIQTIGNTNSNRSWINTNGFTTYVTAYILGDLYVNYGLTASNVNLTYQGNLNIEANLNA